MDNSKILFSLKDTGKGSSVTTKSQMERAKRTQHFLVKNKAPAKFRESINDAYRSRVLDRTLGEYSENKYVSESFKIKHEMRTILEHGEIGHWCKAMTDIRVYKDIDGDITCESIIKKLHDLWMGMDKDEIKNILKIDILKNFGNSPNIILGDTIKSSSQFVNVIINIHYTKETMGQDFKDALAASKNPGYVPQIVINKRFKNETSLKKVYESVTQSKEWTHPVIKSFSTSGEFDMFFRKDDKISIGEYNKQGLLLDCIPVSLTPGSESAHVRGSKCHNSIHFSACPKISAVTGKKKKKIGRSLKVSCIKCYSYHTSFVNIDSGYSSYAKILCYMGNNPISSLRAVCKSCASGFNVVNICDVEMTCSTCYKKKSSFSTCGLGLKNNEESLSSSGCLICEECIEKHPLTSVSRFMYEFSKKYNACISIQKASHKYVSKRKMDELRCEPDNLFDSEHGNLRKKILKIDDTGFGN